MVTRRGRAAIACRKGDAQSMRREGQGPRIGVGALVVQPPAIGDRLVRLIGQCGLLLGLEIVYEASRGLIPQQDDVTWQHGLLVVSTEKSWHIFDPWRGGNKPAGRGVVTP